MKKKEETNSIIEICPIRNVVARFGDKWSLLVLLVIDNAGIVRFNELGRLIRRKAYAQVPPKVEYKLTETGKSLIPIIMQLTEWAQTNMKTVMKHRAEYQTAFNE